MTPLFQADFWLRGKKHPNERIPELPKVVRKTQPATECRVQEIFGHPKGHISLERLPANAKAFIENMHFQNKYEVNYRLHKNSWTMTAISFNRSIESLTE